MDTEKRIWRDKYWENREKLSAYGKAYREANRERAKAYRENKRLAKLGLPTRPLPPTRKPDLDR